MKHWYGNPFYAGCHVVTKQHTDKVTNEPTRVTCLNCKRGLQTAETKRTGHPPGCGASNGGSCTC